MLKHSLKELLINKKITINFYNKNSYFKGLESVNTILKENNNE